MIIIIILIHIMQSIAQWQCEIEDSATSQYKKNHLENAVRKFEKFVESKQSSIREIEEELWIESAAVAKRGENLRICYLCCRPI